MWWFFSLQLFNDKGKWLNFLLQIGRYLHYILKLYLTIIFLLVGNNDNDQLNNLY